MLNLIEVYQKLDSIKRCNCLPRVRDNSVKAHSAGVALSCYIIAQYEGGEIDLSGLLLRALVHDLEEVYSGDVPYPFKQIAGVREKLKQAATPKMTHLLKDFPDILKAWTNAKEKTLEGRILAYADMLDLCMYCMEEIETGNKCMFPVIEEALRVGATFGLKFDKSMDMNGFREKVFLLKEASPIDQIERGLKL